MIGEESGEDPVSFSRAFRLDSSFAISASDGSNFSRVPVLLPESLPLPALISSGLFGEPGEEGKLGEDGIPSDTGLIDPIFRLEREIEFDRV